MILRFTIGASERKARDSNPHPPRGETALAGRLGKPYPTTFRSSGPTGSRTRISATPGRCRPAWTMGPSISASARVDRRGVEPRSPACDAGVVPLDQQPV